MQIANASIFPDGDTLIHYQYSTDYIVLYEELKFQMIGQLCGVQQVLTRRSMSPALQ